MASTNEDKAKQLPPASGAWHTGLPAGDRNFFELSPDRPYIFEGGGVVHQPLVAYETWGTLDATASNAILLCHALTGDAHAYGTEGPGQPTPGWWNDFIGPGKPLDTDRHFIVCANVLGGCQGSSGPSSTDPVSGKRYGIDFPTLTVRDVVRSQRALGLSLGISKWLSVVGGSMGGMQALEWTTSFPSAVRSLVVIASTAAASAQQIAWSSAGRHAITDDPGWQLGQYYDSEPGEGPTAGLANARRIAFIHYRSDEEFNRRFDRFSNESLEPFRLDHRFDIESYLDYQALKMPWRFDANTYLLLNKMMDLHDVGRGRGGVEKALTRIQAPALIMSVRTDFLYPRHQQMRIVDALKDQVHVEHVDIDSDNGHDGFLTEPEQTGEPMKEFINRVEKDSLT
ncbi:MAG: homoserine O-acetyltransferase [Candidatus Poriferisodalaceae bacterium]|jgi:homoserine O-acetyltransferase|tara:strand:- start:1093 stop:2286 length:1194 start_codon:yes stop_codon:yes gene_type:complete